MKCYYKTLKYKIVIPIDKWNNKYLQYRAVYTLLFIKFMLKYIQRISYFKLHH